MTGKVALITGGARGQGRAHAVRLAQEGADIIVTDLCEQMPEVPYDMSTPEDLEETVKLVESLDRRCLGVVADARDLARMRQVVDQAVTEFGHLDTVVINHGIGVPHTIDDEDVEAVFDATVETNLSAVWRTARAAVPALRANGGGSITATSSAAGLITFFGMPGYVAAKHGVIGLVKALASELAEDWIRVNAVCPTTVATPMLHNKPMQILFSGGNPDATVADMEFPAQACNLLPIPWVEPEAIANGVLYLASDEAKYVTGIALPVDAGMTNQPPGITPFVGRALAERG
ncbi:MAG TPA: mycofactocin-coupled SDR family oxidoreductase [Pseudonocardia sp.]|jgi:(+)-trans-carveol dehydrogenase|nr:mycofactocin-coupled SDR family oxidoreductase [Pseudonocardia sp.]